MPQRTFIPPPKRRNDPWELLIVAFFFIVIGGALVFAKHGEILQYQGYKGGRGGNIPLSSDDLHAYGWFGLCAGSAMVAYYFKLRRELRK